MTMSDRTERHPTVSRVARPRWKRRLTGLALLLASAMAVIPVQGALAAGPAPQSLTTGTTAAIKAAYLQAFNSGGGRDSATILAAVEDGPALASTLAQVGTGGGAPPNVVTVNSVKLQGLFKATVNFDLLYQGSFDIGARDGGAVFVGLRWKVSRDTFCSVLALAGAVCPPKSGLPPLNPAAAKTAIQQAYTRAFTGGGDVNYALGAVQDGPALVDTVAQAAQNFPEAFASARVTTGEVVFADPRDASIRFHITYQGGADFGEQWGTAVVVGGQWKVSRATYCTVMGWAGASCPAP